MSDWIDGPPPGADSYGRFPVGVLLQVKDTTQGAGGLVLVGHQNNLGGVCDDCTSEIGPADVVRHRFVWREPTEGEGE
jgi:hypothetical protein